MSLVEDILKDSKTFTDDMEMTIGDKKIPLGELRSMSKTGQDRLTEQMSEAQRDRQSAADLATKAADLVAKLEAAQANNTTRQAPADDDDFDSNNWWTPVRKRLTPIENEQKNLAKQFKDNEAAMQRAAMIFAEDRWEREYEAASPRLKKSKEHKDWTMEKVRDYAVQHKLVDRFGFPSIREATNHLTKADEMQTVRNEEYERGLSEGRTQGRLNVMPRPSTAGSKQGGAAKQINPDRGFNDLSDVVMEDPELSRMLGELGALEPGDIQ